MPAEIPPPSSPGLGAVVPDGVPRPPPLPLSGPSLGFGAPPVPEPLPPGVVPLPGPEKKGGRSLGESSVAKEGVLITPGMGRGVAGEEGEARGAEGDSWGPDAEG